MACAKDGPFRATVQPANDPFKLACAAYVTGLSEAVSQIAEVGLIERTICFPDPKVPETLLDIMLRYFGSKPEERKNPTFLSFVTAMQAAYPCAAGRPIPRSLFDPGRKY